MRSFWGKLPLEIINLRCFQVIQLSTEIDGMMLGQQTKQIMKLQWLTDNMNFREKIGNCFATIQVFFEICESLRWHPILKSKSIFEVYCSQPRVARTSIRIYLSIDVRMKAGYWAFIQSLEAGFLKSHDESTWVARKSSNKLGIPRIWQQRGQSIKDSSDSILQPLNQVLMFGCNRGTWKFSLDRDITGSDVDELETVYKWIHWWIAGWSWWFAVQGILLVGINFTRNSLNDKPPTNLQSITHCKKSKIVLLI